MDGKSFICPICLELLVQPVVMPCNHELCILCFQAHVEKTSLCCPICRVRVSSWARKKAREGKLVDEARWNLIQTLFPERCKKRMRGEDDDESYINGLELPQAISEKGELRKEYEEELLKIKLEKEEEFRASEKVAEELQKEEYQFQQQLKKDEKIAELLQNQELEKVSGNEWSLNTKVRKFLNIQKQPAGRSLRSTMNDRNKMKNMRKAKVRTCLTSWLSKASQDSPGSERESCLPERGMIHDEQYHQCTSKAQEDLDAECGRSHSDALNRETNPLCPKALLTGVDIASKKLKPINH